MLSSSSESAANRIPPTSISACISESKTRALNGMDHARASPTFGIMCATIANTPGAETVLGIPCSCIFSGVNWYALQYPANSLACFSKYVLRVLAHPARAESLMLEVNGLGDQSPLFATIGLLHVFAAYSNDAESTGCPAGIGFSAAHRCRMCAALSGCSL